MKSSFIEHCRRFASISINTRSIRAGLALAANTPHPWPLNARLNRESGGLMLRALNIEVPLDKSNPLLCDPIRAARLGRDPIGHFAYDSTSGLTWSNKRVTVEVQTAEELLIIDEVFASTHYNCVSPESTLIFDIGMNVGYASLFFALNHPNAHVIGFELVNHTSQQAQRNLLLNATLSERIQIEQYGLGNGNHVLKIPYKSDLRGSVGAYSDRIEKFDSIERSTSTVEARIVDATSALKPLLLQHQATRQATLLKIDTEGAEYDIIDSLNSGGLLRNFGNIMIEAHRRSVSHDPLHIVRSLKDSGFSVFHINANSDDISMIYASLL